MYYQSYHFFQDLYHKKIIPSFKPPVGDNFDKKYCNQEEKINAAMKAKYEKDGTKINYGLCRGIGSAAYAIGAFFLGRLWVTFGKNTIPFYIIHAIVDSYCWYNMIIT